MKTPYEVAFIDPIATNEPDSYYTHKKHRVTFTDIS